MRPVCAVFPRIEESSERIPIEIIGEKSSPPILSGSRENRFMYGSHSDERNLPKPEYWARGIHVMMILTKHNVAYRETAAAAI